MSLPDELKAMEKRLDEAIEGVQAEQITMNGKLDDLDYQVGEVRDLLLRVLALLEPEEE